MRRSFAAWMVALGGTSLLLGGPSLARAQGLSLVWDAPLDGCPGAAEVTARAAGLLGSQEAIDASALGADAQVRPLADGTVELTLTTTRPGEPAAERVVVGESCDAVASAAALIVALAIDPEALAARAASTDGAVSADEAAPGAGEGAAASPSASPADPSLLGVALTDTSRGSARPPSLRGAHATTPDAARALASPRHAGPGDDTHSDTSADDDAGALDVVYALSARAIGDVGTLPSLAPGAEVAFGGRAGMLRLDVSAFFLGEQGAVVTNHASARGAAGAAGGRASACLALDAGAFEVGPCAGLDVGAMWASSSGVSDPANGTSTYVSLAGGGWAAWSLADGIALRLDISVAGHLVAPRFVIEGVGALYEPWPVSIRGGLGLEARFR